MEHQELIQLKKAACKIRMGVIEATHGAKSGHPGGSLSAAELFAYLYNKEMNINPQDPQWEDRDRFVLSKGHTAPGLYAALANRGYFPVEDLPTLRHADSYLQGHPNMNVVPGVDMSTGSLGQGVSVAAGMAKAAKYLGKTSQRFYALLGDGELEEGECWEAFLFSAHYKLDNYCVIIDLNGLQIDGSTHEVMNTDPVDAKLRDFGFNVVSIVGMTLNRWSGRLMLSTIVSNRPLPSLCARPKAKGSALWKIRSAGTAKLPTTRNTTLLCRS